MPRIKCDQCQAISATDKGFCPECGAIFVPPYAIVDDANRVTYSAVRDDLGQGKKRKLLVKPTREKAAATDEAASAASTAVSDEEAASVAWAAPEASGAVVSVGEDRYPGLSLFLTFGQMAGWTVLAGGPVLFAILYRTSQPTLAAVGATATFALGLALLALMGMTRVMIDVESHLRALRGR